VRAHEDERHLASVSRELFAGVMAPLVLGGEVRPGHAMGSRVALALTQRVGVEAVDATVLDHVQRARVRRARRLLPLDELPPATDAEWTMAAALHDVLQAVNPTFDTALRRSMATRILALAIATLDRVRAPRSTGEALSRHSWFARVMDLARTDTSVSWWTGSRVFRGEGAPARLRAWPGVRRVVVVAAPHALLELEPLAVDRERVAYALGLLLDRSPLTALATCTRAAPRFAWSGGSLALVATAAGRALALRALDRLPTGEVDTALGRATQSLLEMRREAAGPALDLLCERAIAEAAGHLPGATTPSGPPDAVLARALGATVAVTRLRNGEPGWQERDRRRLLDSLALAAGAGGPSAIALLDGSP
jgi:hypothetical protein